MTSSPAGYFDWNATTPLREVARDAWLQTSAQHWHNPSSLYREAGAAAQRLEQAREELAELLEVDAERVVFTSGATEANNLLLASCARRKPQDKLLISSIEHPSVREAARAFWGGGRVVEMPVEMDGIVPRGMLEARLAGDKFGLVSIIAASNESGLLQPWRRHLELCRDHGVPFHCDAAQWIGKLPAAGMGECDYLTGSAHKFGGPKGCGFLVIRKARDDIALARGGPQERGHRAGTENLPAIVAMVEALKEANGELAEVELRQTQHRDAFIATMREQFPGLRIISEHAPRLWNTVMMVMPAHSNLKWLTRLSRLGFCISTGSACSSGKEGSAAIVSALGASEDELRRVVRVSSGGRASAADWQALAEAFGRAWDDLQAGGRPRI